jgi:hypothetical protein
MAEEKAKQIKESLKERLAAEVEKSYEKYMAKQKSRKLNIKKIEAMWLELKAGADREIGEYFSDLVNETAEEGLIEEKKSP